MTRDPDFFFERGATVKLAPTMGVEITSSALELL